MKTMKTLFIPVKSIEQVEIKDIAKLPKVIGLASSIQFLDQLPEIKKFLESKGRKVIMCGQVLGCDATACEKKEVDAFLYIGDGRFHPASISLKTNKPVFILVNSVVVEFDKKIKEDFEKKKKAALLKFYSSNNVGVLVSTKPGQNNLKKAEAFKKAHKDKNVFIFLFDSIDFGQLENFNFIDLWINTACPRLMDDYDKFNKPVINIDDLESATKVQKD